jgi:SAM-dependent methyltransferase
MPDPAAFYRTRSKRGDHISPSYVSARLDRFLRDGPVEGPALDVGCGVGTNLSVLAEHGIHAVGADLSLAALGEVPRSDRIRAVAADGTRLPFADGSFGGIVATEVLEHVEAPFRIVDELARVVRRGGWLFASSPNYANGAGLRKVWRDTVSGRHDWNPWGAHRGGFEGFMTRRRLRSLLERRFSVVWEEGLDPGLGLSGGLPSIGRLGGTTAGSRLFDMLGRTGLAADRPLGRQLGITTVITARRRA